MILFTPSKKEETEGKFVELFIFEGVEDNEIIDFIYNKKTIMPQRIKMWL